MELIWRDYDDRYWSDGGILSGNQIPDTEKITEYMKVALDLREKLAQ